MVSAVAPALITMTLASTMSVTCGRRRGLPLVRRREVKVRADDLDAKLAERFLDLFQRQRRLRPGLGRDAADAQACPTQLGRAVNAGDPGAKLRGADRGCIAARAAAENRDVNVHH